MRTASSEFQRKNSAAYATSPRASASGLPCSRVISRASSSVCSTINCHVRRRISPRSRGAVAAQAALGRRRRLARLRSHRRSCRPPPRRSPPRSPDSRRRSAPRPSRLATRHRSTTASACSPSCTAADPQPLLGPHRPRRLSRVRRCRSRRRRSPARMAASSPPTTVTSLASTSTSTDSTAATADTSVSMACLQWSQLMPGTE